MTTKEKELHDRFQNDCNLSHCQIDLSWETNRLILTGSVFSHFEKQLAQELALANTSEPLVNQLHVTG
ncbi:MAG: hypothetical protein MPJ24_02990 [Pirellulaceae bacterium]|nr:hypothetical protein [Pirellulaceae bacterium]